MLYDINEHPLFAAIQYDMLGFSGQANQIFNDIIGRGGADADTAKYHQRKMHRRILRQADDSVLRFAGGQPVPVRIGRGLAPLRLEVDREHALDRVCRRLRKGPGSHLDGSMRRTAA